jgi:hypothetical protein
MVKGHSQGRAGRYVFTLVLLLTSFGSAQDLDLELGFNNTLVADHWNPIKLTRRDQPPQTLTFIIDQGTLRAGEMLVTYRQELPAANGLAVFEDDVYIPAWRRFSWRIENAERVFASGSIERREVNPSPLTLLVSARPQLYLGSFGEEARLLELPFALLPERVAAYDGVETLIIDGTTTAPTLEAVSSAAVSGVNVLLLEDLPDSHSELELLAPELRQRLGAGWVARTDGNGIRATLSMLTPLETEALGSVLISDDLSQRPRVTPQTYVLGAASVYALATLLLLRFFGSAGLLTSFALAGLASVGAWTWLRPESPQLRKTQSLVINSDLALVKRVESVFTLPDATLRLHTKAHPQGVRSYFQQGDSLELTLARYSEVVLVHQPRLTGETMRLEGQTLSNLTNTTLSNIYVKGLGSQRDVVAGAELELVRGEEPELSNVYESLLTLLPDGAVVAESEATLHIALPQLLSFANTSSFHDVADAFTVTATR